MTKRKFRPRKRLPQNKLEQFLQDGYTLEDIGRQFNVSTSYVSEYIKMLGLEKKDFEARDQNKKIRKQNKEKMSFMEEFWYLIRHEIGK